MAGKFRRTAGSCGGGEIVDTLGGWISEIKGFYALQALHPVSESAQALWHYLMYRANAVWWVTPLSLRNDEIRGVLGVSPAVLKRARKELIEGKFLMVEPQGGNRPSLYYPLSCVRPGTVVQPSMRPPGKKEQEG